MERFQEVLSGKISPYTFFRGRDVKIDEELLDVARWAVTNLDYETHREIIHEAFEILASARDLSVLPILRDLRPI
ncbi:MAG: hypothetical protein K9W43_13070 [Candidatus Thorarchaeota archaeon]|nr:hypothetical protein [Candidatus Thorarchaeota archaeon]